MTDHDLTRIVDAVARAAHERRRAQHREGPSRDGVPVWDDLPPTVVLDLKNQVLPIITDVLAALPEPGKVQMYEYNFLAPLSDRTDSHWYENQIPEQHDVKTATVWALHMNIRPEVLAGVLEEASNINDALTGEYTYGDSWLEWGEETEDDDNRHLVIYFNAAPGWAKITGGHIADRLAMAAAVASGADGRPNVIPAHWVSTSGDYAEQL